MFLQLTVVIFVWSPKPFCTCSLPVIRSISWCISSSSFFALLSSISMQFSVLSCRYLQVSLGLQYSYQDWIFPVCVWTCWYWQLSYFYIALIVEFWNLMMYRYHRLSWFVWFLIVFLLPLFDVLMTSTQFISYSSISWVFRSRPDFLCISINFI